MSYYEIRHSGIKGQKWGLRRYQNPDGTLTPEGKVRYGGKYGKLRQKIDNGENSYATIHRSENKTKTAHKLIGGGSAVATGLGAALIAAESAAAVAVLPAGVIGLGATAIASSLSKMKYKDLRIEYGVSEANRANRNYDSATASDSNVGIRRAD